MKATAVKERPMLMSPSMAKAVQEDRKTQTRRLMNPQPPEGWRPLEVGRYCPAIELDDGTMRDGPEIFGACDDEWGIACPYGGPGDRLRFLSSWAVHRRYDKIRPTRLRKTVRVWTQFDGLEKPAWLGKLRPGRFMPLWMRSRMPVAEITEVRVQRLQEISKADICNEGWPGALERAFPQVAEDGVYGSVSKGDWIQGGCDGDDACIEWFADLWDKINGDGAWDRSDWVWAITFKRIATQND